MKMERLGDHVQFLSGFAFKSQLFNDDRKGLPIIRIRDVQRGRSETFYSGDFSNRYLVETGDYLIGMDGEFNLARWQSGPALLNQRVCKIDTVSKEVDRYYLGRFLAVALKEIEDVTPFVTVKHLSVKTLNDIQIPLPPLAEQKRIAAILDAADALRAKRRESLAQLDTLLQSTFLDLFGDPVTNPKGWGPILFEKIGSSRLGKMLDKGKEVGDCQYPYLANYNVQWGRFVLDELRQMDFDESDRNEFDLRSGDLLVCEGGEVGRTAIWRSELDGVYFQKALHRVRLDPTKAVPEFILYFMWFMAKNGGFQDFTNSATIAHLTGAKLKGLPVPLPPLDLQHHFATIVESIERQKTRLRAHLAELDTLFASLQSRAFNGEL